MISWVLRVAREVRASFRAGYRDERELSFGQKMRDQLPR